MKEDDDPIDPEVLDMIAQGIVSPEQVEAAIERRNSAAVIGKIAVELKMLEPRQVMEILRIQRSRGFRFGELCVRKGWLQPEQVLHLLSLQRQRARPLTHYLLQSGAVTPAEVERFRR